MPPRPRSAADVAIYPFAYVGDGAVIGDGTTLHPGAVIGEGCKLGRDCIIHPNAVLYQNVTLGDRVEIHAGSVLGGDGFGYRQVDGRHVKIPHSGRLEVENDVEVGANCTIDRATFETTRIGEGTKIDNLVMIGHNNQIGRHNLLCGQVGIAGSCKTGDYVVMAGQAGIKDKTQIGDRVIVGAQAGVHRNIPDGQNVLGSPAIPVREQRRIFQMIARLPEMHRQLRDLAAQIAAVSALVSAGNAVQSASGDGGDFRSLGDRHPRPINLSTSEPACLSRQIETNVGVSWCECDRLAGAIQPPGSTRADRADRPAGGERPVSDPVRRGGAAARTPRGLRGDQVRSRRRAARASAIRFDIVGIAKLGG